jgi:hypothetical protein
MEMNPMQATSTPTISQPRVGGPRSFGAVVGLAAALTIGAAIGVVVAPQTTYAPLNGLAEESIRSIQAPRPAHEDALTRAHRLISERQRARAAEAAQAADQMRYWNMYRRQPGIIIAPAVPARRPMAGCSGVPSRRRFPARTTDGWVLGRPIAPLPGGTDDLPMSGGSPHGLLHR